MPRIEQSPIFLIEKRKDGYRLSTIYRSLGYRHAGDDHTVVRYERQWYRLYDATELKKFFRIKRRRKNSIFFVDGRLKKDFDFKPLPFIKSWDKPYGRYPTFGKLGL